MRIIDMKSDPRAAHFAYFRDFPNPCVGLTVQCDITPLRGKKPFFLHLLYCAANAANAVPELRRRIRGEEVVEYASCHSSHTVLLPDDTYCYCELDCSLPLAAFLPYAVAQIERAKSAASIEEHDPLGLFFVSCVPSVSFTGLTLPTAKPAHSNPQITFGKAYEHDGKYLLPVNLTVHHALCDGVHMGRFFRGFEEICKNL